jgi:very-short-patch-repair endonuclease
MSKIETSTTLNEKIFYALLKQKGIALPKQEYKFHEKRKWRFDYCWPEVKLAVEVEGGIFSNGRHTRGSGYLGDMEKYNAATLEGYKLLRFTPQQLTLKSTIDSITEVLKDCKTLGI